MTWDNDLLDLARVVSVYDPKPGLPDWYFGALGVALWGAMGCLIIGEWFGVIPQ
ncbi:hypothetical protein CKALI_11420 [Corynebacterium kalinowskii]|uniref:Uncharacterized protein n=1 Tax=Corynebacterium kalinowskii TaxID=2675216 RepID=A0A6B8W7S0_9CORY|nr:hypothetical protein [Corynebacterium kalinowskii]QGU03128.1 hypothetical protein CKALI_11420 [Corynebacterium kalinowskii]